MSDFTRENYEIWQIKPLTVEEYSQLDPEKRLEYLCLTGHLAANSHNTQPWRFKINAPQNEIMVCVDQKSILPASDVDGRQAVISIGCAMKNIEVAAAFLQRQIKIDIINFSKEDFKPKIGGSAIIQLVKITLLPSEKITENIEKKYQAIFTRKVVRAEYDEQRLIPNELLDQIEQLSNNLIKVHLVSDRLRRLMIGEFQGQADNFVINSKKFSRELGEWLLPNDSKSFIGMPGIDFGLKDEEAERLHQGLLGETALTPEDGLKFSLAGKIGIEKSPTVCFLTSNEDTIASWLETGKIIEDIFLLLESNGISFTIHAGIAEVSLINKLFSMSFLGTTRRIMNLFRIGYIKRPADLERPHAPRLPLNKVII